MSWEPMQKVAQRLGGRGAGTSACFGTHRDQVGIKSAATPLPAWGARPAATAAPPGATPQACPAGGQHNQSWLRPSGGQGIPPPPPCKCCKLPADGRKFAAGGRPPRGDVSWLSSRYTCSIVDAVLGISWAYRNVYRDKAELLGKPLKVYGVVLVLLVFSPGHLGANGCTSEGYTSAVSGSCRAWA